VSIINIYHSVIDNSYDTIKIDNNISIRQALPKLDYENSLIYVNGFEVDENYILKYNDICTIRKFPTGKPGSSPLEIFLNFITFGLYTFADMIVSGATGKTIGQHAKEGLLKWLAPDALDTNTADSLEPIPQLRGAKNQSNRNKPIPIVLGKHLYTPMFIGSPYTEIAGEDGQDQYYTALYLLGWGKLRVDELRLGPVSGLAKNPDPDNFIDGYLLYDKNDGFCDPSLADSNPQLELRQIASEVNLYPQRVVEERLGIELMNVEGRPPFEVIRFSAKNPQKVQVEITLNNGLIAYNDKGEKQNALVEISVEWRDSGSWNWQNFAQFGTDQTGITYTAPVSTITRQKPKVMRFVAEKTFTYNEVNNAVNRTLELRIQRMNPKDLENNRIADTVYLTAIRTWCYDYEASEAAGTMVAQRPIIPKYRDKTARLGFRIKATENLQGTLDSLNCMVTSYARTWNGVEWSNVETPTNNPAAVALKILQSPALGNNAYADSMLDLDSFGEFYEWCAEREYTCNGVLTSDRRVDDLLSAVLATGRGMRILNGNRYGILIDKPRENPVTVLNSQNVLEAKNQKNFEDLPDGFSIKFVNKDDGYQETEVFVTADGSSRPGPTSRIESIDMPFVTDHKQVIRNGRYLLACRHLRPEIWIRKLSYDGYLVGIGNRVDVQDDTIVVGIGEGATIIGLTITNNYITEIQTDGVFDVIDMNKLYGIKIMQFDGINPGKARTIQVSIPEPGIYRNFPVSIPLNTDPPIPHEGDIVSFGIFDRITTPAICFGKKNNGDGTFEVTLIPYQEGIYTTDSGPIPPYEANITTPQGLSPAHSIPPDSVTKNEVIEVMEGMDLRGPPAVVYELRTSVLVIIRNQTGHSPDYVSCSQIMIEGNNPPIISGKNLLYITSTNNNPQPYSNPIQVSWEWDWIEFILTDNDTELDRQRVPVLRDGDPAVVFELVPSTNVIGRGSDGVTLFPPIISCGQQSITGTGKPQPSDLQIRYLTSINRIETDYTGPIIADPEWDWIEFRLYDDDVLLDLERIPILNSGENPVFLDLINDFMGIRCDEDGFPFLGALPVTNRAILYQGNAVQQPIDRKTEMYPGDPHDPSLVTSFSEISLNMIWSLENAPSGVKINHHGEISVSNETMLADNNEIIVIAHFEGKRYEALFVLQKVYSGKSTIILNLENQSFQVSCFSNGRPKPEQLPLNVQAFLYRGSAIITEGSDERFASISNITKYPQDAGSFEPLGGVDFFPVNPTIIWSVGTEEQSVSTGVSIDQNGIITVSENAELEDNIIEIPVIAIFRSIQYMRIFRIIKVLDGIQGYRGEDGEKGEPAPKYLGKTATIATTNIVYIQFTSAYSANVAANTGDYIAYVGVSEQGASIWKKNYCLRWSGSGWEHLDPLSSANTDYYMRAFSDIIDGAEPGVFSYVMAQKIMTLELILNDGGNIHSYNYNPGVSGFKINYNGDVEFNNGVFRSELAARQIRITGNISSGTGHLLKANSVPAEVQATSGWISAGYEGLLKEIRTLAQGTCTLCMIFPKVAPARTGDINIGSIRVTVNDNDLAGYSNFLINTSAGDIALEISDISLDLIINTIRLYARPTIGGNLAPNYSVINTIFELRCAQDPGFLGVFG